MDAVLCLRQTTQFQSMELERPEAIRGLESGTRSRLWSTRGHCACRQEVTFFGLRSDGTVVVCLNQFSSDLFGSGLSAGDAAISFILFHHKRAVFTITNTVPAHLRTIASNLMIPQDKGGIVNIDTIPD